MLFGSTSLIQIEANEQEWIIIEGDCKFLYNPDTKEKIKENYQVKQNGELELISIEDAQLVLNSSAKIDEVQEMPNTEYHDTREVPTSYWVKSFLKSSERQINGSRIRISNDQYDAGSITASQDITVSMTVSTSASIGVDTILKNAIINSSASLSVTKSISSRLTYTLEKREGRGYLAFTPYLQEVVGTAYIKTYSQSGYLLNTDSAPTTAKIPLQLSSGTPLGMYSIVYY